MKQLLLILLFFTLFFKEASSQTYYRYQPRKTQSTQVNYSDLANDLSDNLIKAQRRRNEQLRQMGWSSEAEYRAYVRYLRKERKLKEKEDKEKRSQLRKAQMEVEKRKRRQKKLEKMYLRGNDRVKKRTLNDGSTEYYVD